MHARSTFTHILDQEGKTVFERDLPAGPEAFLSAIQLYRQGLVVGCECMFAWYWLADLCEDHELPFVLGHALYLLRGGIDAGATRLALPQGPLVYLFDVDPKRPPNVDRLLRTNRGHGNTVRGAAFSPDGSRLITVDVLGVVKHWDLADREPRLRTPFATGPALNACILPSPDGTRVAFVPSASDLARRFRIRDAAQRHPQKAELVKLRYFAGLTADQAAAALGISPSTADRNWAYARAWLRRAISEGTAGK